MAPLGQWKTFSKGGPKNNPFRKDPLGCKGALNLWSVIPYPQPKGQRLSN